MLALRGRRGVAAPPPLQPSPKATANNDKTPFNNSNNNNITTKNKQNKNNEKSSLWWRKVIPSNSSLLMILSVLMVIDFIRMLIAGVLYTWNTPPALLLRSVSLITVILTAPPLIVIALYKWKTSRVKTLVICLLCIPGAATFDLIHLCLTYNNLVAKVLIWLALKFTILGLANILLFVILKKPETSDETVDFAPGDELFFRRYNYLLSYIPLWGPLFWIMVKRRFRRYQ
jgi:hypothetical protein